MRTVEIRVEYLRGNGVSVTLADHDRVVGVDHSGNEFWVYIERVVEVDSEG